MSSSKLQATNDTLHKQQHIQARRCLIKVVINQSQIHETLGETDIILVSPFPYGYHETAQMCLMHIK